jgi:hypothetical protein
VDGLRGESLVRFRRPFAFALVLLLTTAAVAAEEEAGGKPRPVFLTPRRIAVLRQRLREGAEPQASAFREVRQVADEALRRAPQPPEHLYVPGYYRDAEGHARAKRPLMEDAGGAYAMALVAAMASDDAACPYRRRTVAYLKAWATGIRSFSREDDSTLSFSYHFTPLILAADLVRRTGDWPEKDRAVFARFLREKALPMNTMGAKNNWGNWGLSMAIAIAAYTDDDDLFAKCVDRWRWFIAHQVAEDGHLPHEVNRSGGRRGLWYTNFALLPQTIAAEVAAVRGTDLYDYRSPNGRTLRQAYARAAEWIRRPETFPYWKGDVDELRGVEYVGYFEVLLPRWANADAAAMLDRVRPARVRHGAPYLTFTHGGLPPQEPQASAGAG